MDTKGHRSLIKAILGVLRREQTPITDIVLVESDGQTVHVLREGKWIDGRFKKNIRVDQPTHFQGLKGQEHAHVYGRRGNEQVIVNMDGTASHGKGGPLTPEDAEPLRKRGYQIRDDNMVECVTIDPLPEILFE